MQETSEQSGTSEPALGELALGATVDGGRYRVDGVLGRGAFGVTYRALDTKLGRPVALKQLTADGPAVRQRFLAEACALARFTHPGIVRVHDVIEHASTPYVVMELVRGRSLAEVLAERTSLPVDEALPMIELLGEALRAVHEAGFVHRDVKPENVIAADDGRVVLLDFGAVRSFAAGADDVTLLTPGYAPPEQYGEGPLGPPADIYALGATAYHLLGGRRPPAVPDRREGIRLVPLHHLSPEVPRAVSDAVAWALELAAADRPQSVREFLAALRGRAAASTPVAAAVADNHTVEIATTRLSDDAVPAPAGPPVKRVVLPVAVALGALSASIPVIAVVVWVLGVLPVLNGVASTRLALRLRREARGLRWWDAASAPFAAVLRWLWSLVVALVRTLVVVTVLAMLGGVAIITVDLDAATIGDALHSLPGRLALGVAGGLGLALVVPSLLRGSDAYVPYLPRLVRVRRSYRAVAWLVAFALVVAAVVSPLSLWPVDAYVHGLR